MGVGVHQHIRTGVSRSPLHRLDVAAAGEPTISMTALLELLKDADPEMKAKLRMALHTFAHFLHIARMDNR